ncbi:MAG: periplasmic heavy metal sensor [Cyanobacteria bacterium RI_101]|nr:periplasmic heavy metal sensor [Cyanobacteria bacterium RI_101]
MSRSLFTLCLVASLFSLGQAPLLASPGETAPLVAQAQNRGSGAGQRGERAMERLNLSAEQRQQLQSIRQKYAGQTEKLETDLRSQQGELRQLMAGSADKETIRKKHNQVTQTRQKLGDLRFEMMLDSREILTPQQRQEFAQMAEEWGGRMKRGRRPQN